MQIVGVQACTPDSQVSRTSIILNWTHFYSRSGFETGQLPHRPEALAKDDIRYMS